MRRINVTSAQQVEEYFCLCSAIQNISILLVVLTRLIDLPLTQFVLAVMCAKIRGQFR